MKPKVIANSNVANNVNTVSSPMVGHNYLGLLEISDTNSWGIAIENRNYCGAYIMTKSSKIAMSLDSVKEEKFIKDEQTTIICLRGSNKVFVKRFKSKVEAIKWFHKVMIVDSDQDGSLLSTTLVQEEIKES